MIKRLLRILAALGVFVLFFPYGIFNILYCIIVVPIYWIITGKSIIYLMWENTVVPYMNFIVYGKFSKDIPKNNC